MTQEELMIEKAYNTIQYSDTMPELCWESGTGFFFQNATEAEIEAFRQENELPNMDQGFIERWIDDQVDA